MIKRIIFDLDNTLIPFIKEWDKEIGNTCKDFNIPYDEETDFPKFNEALVAYEKSHRVFDKDDMNRFYVTYTNKELPSNFIDEWVKKLSNVKGTPDKKLIELLKYLKSKYSLVVASNWYLDQQVAKLKTFGLYEYFDMVLTCDKYERKPFKGMLDKAMEGYSKDEVVIVGDNYKVDVAWALNNGIYSYYLTKVDPRRSKKFTVIKEIYELKNYL